MGIHIIRAQLALLFSLDYEIGAFIQLNVAYMHWKAGILILLVLLLNWNSSAGARDPTNDGIMTSSPLAHLEELYAKAEDLISSLKVEINRMQKTSRSAETTKIAKQQAYPPSCLAAMINTNGIYTIEVPGLRPFPVSCDTGKAGAGWTVIQRRQDGSENFYRSWTEYRTGFGNLSAEFFMGLEQLHRITNAEPYELFVQLEDFDGETHYAKYDRFVIANEAEAYALRVLGKYTGDAGDSLRYHVGMPFSTFDNDKTPNHCALRYVGAWWYNACLHSNLNGQYVEGGNYEVKLSGRGICWQTWRGYDYGYKLTQMMIRPRCRAASKAP